MMPPITMDEYFTQLEFYNDFTNDEFIYIYNFMNTLQTMVASLGVKYNAVWRTLFSDMQIFEEMMKARGLTIRHKPIPFEGFSLGENSSVITFSADVDVNENTTPAHCRHQLIRQIFSMSDEEIISKFNLTKVEESDEDILNALQDNL